MVTFRYIFDAEDSNRIPQFWSQLVASIFSVIASLVVTNWQIDNIPGLCDPLNKDKVG